MKSQFKLLVLQVTFASVSIIVLYDTVQCFSISVECDDMIYLGIPIDDVKLITLAVGRQLIFYQDQLNMYVMLHDM